jgi:heterodisulfide reductase subunit A
VSDEATGGDGTQGGRTGLYFCRCGPNLGTVVRLPELSAAHWPGAADVAVHDVLCSAEGQAWLAERIRARGVERVVVGACSPREHEQTFRGVLAAAGRSPWLLQLVNLREQVEWAGGDPAAATARARRLVAAGLRRVALHRDLPRVEVEVSADVLVVGGGAAGLSAALALAGEDRRVVLIERSFVLGGLASQLDRIHPGLECASCFMEPVIDAALHHPGVEVLTGAELRRLRGTAGRFAVEVALRPRGVDPLVCLGCPECVAACPVEMPDPLAAGLAGRKAIHLPYRGCLPHAAVLDRTTCLRATAPAGTAEARCEACAAACPFGAVRLDAPEEVRELEVGAIVIATGLAPSLAEGPEGVVSSFQLERMLHPDGPTGGAVRGAGGRTPAEVLLATTAAEEDGVLAAREILKLARLVREQLPSARVAVAGGLHRAPGLARAAAELGAAGVELLEEEIEPASITREGRRVMVRLSSRGGAAVARHADLLVVHGPVRPSDRAAALGALLRLAPDTRGFFPDGADPFEPTATRVAGVHVAGAAAGPRSIRESIRDGAAAAGRVLASLVPGRRLALEPLAVQVEAVICGGCGACVAVCPFGAVARDPASGKALVDPVHCRGCGTCAAACPTGAASARHFTGAQISAEISALLAGAGRIGRGT